MQGSTRPVVKQCLNMVKQHVDVGFRAELWACVLRPPALDLLQHVVEAFVDLRDAQALRRVRQQTALLDEEYDESDLVRECRLCAQKKSGQPKFEYMIKQVLNMAKICSKF